MSEISKEHLDIKKQALDLLTKRHAHQSERNSIPAPAAPVPPPPPRTTREVFGEFVTLELNSLNEEFASEAQYRIVVVLH